jgi:hypothetical protein
VIDFGPYHRREKTLPELAQGVPPADLARLTDEMCDLQLRLLAGAEDPDVTFMPEDPEAEDRYATNEDERHLPWTLWHLIFHATASSEEAAAVALTLARGVEVTGRSRYEAPWPLARTAAQLRARIEESRRMRLAMLAAWPDQPHLENVYQSRPGRPALNAVARFLGGLAHDDSHLEQIARVLAQARQSAAYTESHP